MLGIKLDSGETVSAMESVWVAALVHELDRERLHRVAARVKQIEDAKIKASVVIPRARFERTSLSDLKVEVQ